LEYRELPVFSVRTCVELAKFKDLRFRLMPALDKSFWGKSYAELGVRMINGSELVRMTLTEKLRAQNKEIWDRWCTTMFLGQFMLESLCYQRSGKSTGCLGWLQFGIRCTTCGWSVTLTMEADLELENRYGSVNCMEQFQPREQTLLGFFSVKDFRDMFLTSVGDHLTDEMHNRQWQLYGANLSACMGFLPGRSQRHQCRGAAVGTMGYYPSTQLAWGTSGYEGAAHPTIEDVLRCNGEGRGGVILLYQAIARGLARFVDCSGVLQPIPVEDVDMIADGVLYFSQADVHKKYESDSTGSVFVGAANLFRNSEEYHDKVIGMRPHPLCPDPSGTLYWEGQLRDGMTADGLPPNYIPLDKLKKMENWPEKHKD
jgi:hypothetical protein